MLFLSASYIILSMITSEGILYMEPSKNTSPKPLIDEATKKMTAALRQGVPGARWRGVHQCACGAHSSNCDYTLPNGEQTNSLSIHYLAYHRSDVPKKQLEKVLQLECGEAEPTNEEMGGSIKSEATKEQKPKFEWKPGMR
jgi:hypothetical protein